MLDISWNNILHSNAFNFIVMVIIFAIIFKKIKVSEKINNLKDEIKNKVENSDKEKEESHIELKEIQKSVENVGAQINKIITEAKQTAQALEQNSILEINKMVENVKVSVEKAFENLNNKTKENLSKTISIASINFAKDNIEKILQENINLHKKFIAESIDELDEVKIS